MVNVAKILDNLLDKNVLVIGDVMLDHYLYGQVSRISPEAPVPIVNHQSESFRLGGAANVALNLEGLGIKTRLISAVGRDETGATLTALAKRELTDVVLIPVDGRPTTQKTRVVDKYQQILRIDRETDAMISAGVSDELLRAIHEAFDADIPPQIIVLSDYNKGLLGHALTQAIIELAQAASIAVYIDPKGHDFSKYSGATLLTPNISELENVSSIPCNTDAALESSAKRLQSELELDLLVVTLGPRGLLKVQPDALSFYPAQTQEVFDVSGAGDTVLAAIAAGRLAGQSIDTSLEFANLCAAKVIQKRGTTPISVELLLPNPSQDPTKSPNSRFDESLEATLARWAKQHKRIVFTNGCFDLLHPGHLQLLEFAKAQGDKLIVGLNSDASVKRLKGADRPLNLEQDRVSLLQALRVVDFVVVFEQDTPLELIEEIRPDVLVKGADYLGKVIVGQVEVESWGGEVKLCPLADGYSTTKKVFEIAGRE